MDTINFTEARKSLSSVIDSVTENENYTLIKRRQKPDAVIMSLDYFNGMMETMHLLSSPANAQRLVESIGQVKAGSFEEKDLIYPDND